MSNKPKRSRHKVPVNYLPKSDEITPEYEAEVQRSTAKLEKDFRDAQKRLEAAERRRERAERNRDLAEQDKKNAAGRRKAQRDFERHCELYEKAWNEWKRLDALVRGRPVADAGKRVYLTAGRENPRAVAVREDEAS